MNIYEKLIHIINDLPEEYERRFDHLYLELINLAESGGEGYDDAAIRIEGILMGKEYVYTSHTGRWHIMYDGEMVDAGYETGEATKAEATRRLVMFYQYVLEDTHE